MATIQRCDRCGLTDVTTHSAMGKDLCVACVADFAEWVSCHLKSGHPAPRASGGKRFLQVLAIIEKHGHVTSALLQAVSGLTGSQACWYLHSARKQGRLVFHGKGVFTLPKSEAAE